MNARASENRFYFEIFLVAAAVILLEISFTRIFSFKVFYYFTYLIIGISLLGLGSGGIFVAIFPWLRNQPTARLVPLLCTACAPATLLAYFVCALVQLNASQLTTHPIELVKLAVVCAVIFLPFLLTGVVLSTIFSALPEKMSRLYFVDLIGAGVGCVAVVFLMKAITPPGVAVLCAFLYALAGLRGAIAEWRALLPIGAVCAAIGLGGALMPGLLPDPIADAAKTMAPERRVEDEHIAHSEWNPAFRVDVIAAEPGSAWEGRHQLVHDGNIGSSILAFDGDRSQLEFYRKDPRSTPYAILGDDVRVVIIGAAGGQEVLASLFFGAKDITGVELNSVTASIMKGKFAEFSGNIMNQPEVTLINAEGRNYINTMDEDRDLIWLVAPDSYSAMNAASAGAFVLSESYLYTVEMVMECLGRLTDRGLLTVQFGEIAYENKPKRTARYLATAREAFRRMGIPDFDKHVLVGTTPDFMWPMASILIKQSAPFTKEEIARFRANFADLDTRLADGKKRAGPPAAKDYRTRPIIWHAAGEATHVDGTHAVNKVIELPAAELEAWHPTFAYDVTPIDDNHPFFWHFVRFDDALMGDWGGTSMVWDPEEATGERVLIVLLAFAVVFAGIFVLLPLFAIRDVWQEIPSKLPIGLYFSALGLGFMFFEVSLIQQLTLLLGYPTHSLTVTLFALLTFTGLGSLATDYWVKDRARALGLLFGVLVLLMLWLQFGLAPAISALIGMPFAARVVCAVLMVAPLGLCLGSLMPIGISAVAELTPHKQQMVAWCWAVNGFFSVVASILSTMLAMAYGFRIVVLCGTLIYAVGLFAMTRVLRTRANA